MDVSFTINGELYKVNQSNVPLDTSLNTFIRNHAHLKGTKFMCLEGGCGACIVTLKGVHPATKEKQTWAVNSCLTNVYSCHGLDIITIEGVGNKKDGYHVTQKRLADLNGTQCGYCSPGMVMNMFSLLESKNGAVTMEEVENSFGGNICRCTGYRPILDAFKSLAVDADEKLIAMCKDIEDLDKTCPKTGNRCAGFCHKTAESKKGIHLAFEEEKEWHKVYSLNELFALLNKSNGQEYMLVAGNTAHGVYRRSDSLKLFIDITGIEELHTHTIGNELVFGGNVNLTEMMVILEKAAASNPNFEYCRHLVKHIDLIANVPVRNAGTIAGNLSIKHAKKEFPSDLFLMLEAARAIITVMESEGKASNLSPMDYLSFNMSKKVITKVTLPQLDNKNYVYRSYKIMPRAQNAHAYVNAAFLAKFSNQQISDIRICFGGINPDFIHASATEKLLIGKDLYTDDTLQAALESLANEITPDWVLPDASPEFRKNLALALFYKFVLNTCPDEKVKSSFKSGGPILERPISSGTQTFDTYKDNWPLTQPVPKIEAAIQCSGEAQYANDIPHQPRELWAAFVVGTVPHGTIENIDPADALKVKGVHAFYSAKDIPGENNFSPGKLMMNFEVEEIFCSQKVLFNGQPVGVIVADTHSLAIHAASMVKIIYEKKRDQHILPTIKDVLNADEKEKIDRVFDQPFGAKGEEFGTNTVHKINGHFEIGGQYHYTMETQTCVCVPNEDGINIYAATQWMDHMQIAISNALNIPENKINIEVRRLGGGYGGKISRPSLIGVACALASVKLNRPIRFVMSLEANMDIIGKRYASINDYEVEVDDQGKIQKLTNNYAQDYGCSLNEPVQMSTTMFFKNCYVNKSWNINAQAVKTDAPSHTWCRAPGTTEGIAMIENIMDHIAFSTKRDPVDVRYANMPEDSPLRKIFSDFINSIDYVQRRRDINTFNAANRWRKRGIAAIPMEYGLHFFGALNAMVSIYHVDGTVAISHGGIEMGQGIHTKVAQVAAHILGVPLSSISVKPSNNFVAANAFVTGGSMTSEAICFAVIKACETLLERLAPIKSKIPEAKWMDIVHAAYNESINLSATHMYKGTDVKHYTIWGCSAVECEMDLLTGNVHLTRVDILEDTGESLSPLVDIGQVEGAFVMGLGYWLTENLMYNNQNGQLLTNRTWNYKPPGAKDIPIDFRVTFLQKSSNEFGVLRAKATGEPALCMAVVIIFALRHALFSARSDAGLPEEFFYLGAPTTPEDIFLKSGNKFNQFNL